MTADLFVVDADGHLCEPARLWEDNLPARLREHGIRLRWNEQTGYDECLVEDRMATDRGLVGLGNAGESFDEFGRGRHYEDLNPAGFDARERVKVLDAEGIDVAVMYPGPRPEARRDPRPRPRGRVVQGLQRLARGVVRGRLPTGSPAWAHCRCRTRNARPTRRAASRTSD